MKLLLCSLVAVTMALPVVPSQQETGLKAAQPITGQSYPNPTEGLRQLLNDLLLIAKSDDEAKLRSQIVEMKIPDYESWFTGTFGKERGEKWAAMYEKTPQTAELQFQMLCVELARQQGQISIDKPDTTKMYGPLPGPLDEYRANWKKTDASVGPDTQSIGLFYFVDGKFRLNAFVHDVRILSANKGGTLVPAKLIKKVEPLYPKEAQALRIQGLVAVNVIVRKDGTVAVQNVGAGHPLLAPAAIEAVQQWRYEPTTVNGDPVDVQAKVYVTFAFKPRAEQK